MAAALFLSACGPEVVGRDFACDDTCQLAFTRVSTVQLSDNAPVGGNFRVLASGLNERTSFNGNGSQKGVQLDRDDLAKLWTLADSPALSAAMKSDALSATCRSTTQTTSFRTSQCLWINSSRQSLSGCWCGAPPDGPVRQARDELTALFAKAFPK